MNDDSEIGCIDACSDRERGRDGDREFRSRDDADDKTLGDWRRKPEGAGRDRRGVQVFVILLFFFVDNTVVGWSERWTAPDGVVLPEGKVR